MMPILGKVVFGRGPFTTPPEPKRPIVKGLKVVFGVPKTINPLVGAPHGKVRFRFRNNKCGCVFIRNECGVYHFVLLDQGDRWGLLPQGSNIRQAPVTS